MHPFPHRYRTAAHAQPEGIVHVTAESAVALETTAPPEFDGPPGYWSPETLLVASIADCFILSFRAVARASRLEWLELAVDVDGVLDRVDGVTRFVSFTVKPRLQVPPGTAESRARAVLDKAKRACLVTNSLVGECAIESTVMLQEPAAAG